MVQNQFHDASTEAVASFPGTVEKPNVNSDKVRADSHPWLVVVIVHELRLLGTVGDRVVYVVVVFDYYGVRYKARSKE